MTIIFYPHEEDMQSGSTKEKLDVLLEAAQRYKGVVLDSAAKASGGADTKLSVPREMTYAFNWQEIAKILREIREMPEINQSSREAKADCLSKLAEVYEVLRAARMPKLEAVRLALANEVTQLRRASGSQVA